MSSKVVIIIVFSAILTYLTRFPLLLAGGKRKLPPGLEKFMSFIAPAVLTALIVPSIFLKEGTVDLSFSNIYLLASAVSVAAALLSKNMLVTVICGVLTTGVLVFLL